VTLAEQASRRVALARDLGAQPRRWVLTGAAEQQLIADAAPDAWSADGALLHGLPIERGHPRSEWGLDLVLAPRSI
jgi:hypothetical protein